MSGIYIITNGVTGKAYVGQSFDIKKRVRDHFTGKATQCRGIHNAIKKYGKRAFDVEIIEYPGISEESLNAVECWQIAKRNTLAPVGYNLKSGGRGGRHSIESRQKMALSRTGYKHSSETRAKIGKSGKGRKHSDEARAKMSKAKKGKTLSDEARAKMNKARKEKPLSDEARAKMSKAKKGKTLSDETRAKISASKRGRYKGMRVRENPNQLTFL